MAIQNELRLHIEESAELYIENMFFICMRRNMTIAQTIDCYNWACKLLKESKLCY